MLLCTLAGAGLTSVRQAFLLLAVKDCFIHLSDTVPSKVSGISLTKTVENGTAALMVNWTTPQSDVAISQYQVQYRRSGITSWNNATLLSGSPPATSTILPGLDAGTEYNIRVRAVSELGAGEWSVEQTERTFTDSKFCVLSAVIRYICSCGTHSVLAKYGLK